MIYLAVCRIKQSPQREFVCFALSTRPFRGVLNLFRFTLDTFALDLKKQIVRAETLPLHVADSK